MSVKSSLVTTNDQSYRLEPMEVSLRLHDKTKQDSPPVAMSTKQLHDTLKTAIHSKQGIHTVCYLKTAGFQYTGNGDTTHCKDCGLEVSNWTKDMTPFTIHSEQKPDCPFVRATLQSSLSSKPAFFLRTNNDYSKYFNIK